MSRQEPNFVPVDVLKHGDMIRLEKCIGVVLDVNVINTDDGETISRVVKVTYADVNNKDRDGKYPKKYRRELTAYNTDGVQAVVEQIPPRKWWWSR